MEIRQQISFDVLSTCDTFHNDMRMTNVISFIKCNALKIESYFKLFRPIGKITIFTRYMLTAFAYTCTCKQDHEQTNSSKMFM